jgi:hypothetical protein
MSKAGERGGLRGARVNTSVNMPRALVRKVASHLWHTDTAVPVWAGISDMLPPHWRSL